jgi:hypothetical protein
MLLLPLNPLNKNLMFFSPLFVGLKIVVLGTTTSAATSDYKISSTDPWWWLVVARHS